MELSNVKSCLKYNSKFSNFFDLERGVLHVEALFPMLFSMYLIDFEKNNQTVVPFSKKIYLFLIM